MVNSYIKKFIASIISFFNSKYNTHVVLFTPCIEEGIAVIDLGFSKQWYRNGELHREDGPAIVYGDGYKFWYKKHRKDGPAIEHTAYCR